MFRQLLAATLCALLVAPAYPSESPLPRSSSTPNHTYDAETYSKTRVWGSNQKILLHFRATLLLSEKQRWGYAKCSWKNVVGSVVTYDYDAFGNLIHQTGTTPNNYLFAGEQFDPDLNLYYNRARYLNVSTGRFWTPDSFEGDKDAPLSLHRYLYAWDDSINHNDRSGHELDELIGAAVRVTIAVAAIVAVALTIEYVTSVFGTNLTNDQAKVVNKAIAVLDPVPTLVDEAWVLHSAKYRTNKPPYLAAICAFASGCFAAAHLGFLFLDDQFFAPDLLHDSVERAAVLLHEAYHLEGGNEHDAYANVWVNKERFGWTRDPYSGYFLWGQVEAQTRHYAPELFQ